VGVVSRKLFAFICCCEGYVGEGLMDRQKAQKGKVHDSSIHMTKEVKENIEGIISKVFEELLCRELRHGFNRM
jgi:hypothetical protein